MTKIYGMRVDICGRCQHWHQDCNVVANKCDECRLYFSCYLCHDTLMHHNFKPMHFNDLCVLCGVCDRELSGTTYVQKNHCPYCLHKFNPNCAIHQDLYFC